MATMYVHFERGRHDVDGPTFGPFDFVQLTYADLRDEVGDAWAYHNTDSDEWHIGNLREPFSDVIVYAGDPPLDVTPFLNWSEWASTPECEEREREQVWIELDKD